MRDGAVVLHTASQLLRRPDAVVGHIHRLLRRFRTSSGRWGSRLGLRDDMRTSVPHGKSCSSIVIVLMDSPHGTHSATMLQF